MSFDDRRPAPDWMLRAIGLLLLLAGALAMRGLAHMAHAPARHDPSLGEMGLAAVGFLGVSAGCGLAALGAHIRDEVQVSARWRQNRLARPKNDAPGRQALSAKVDLPVGKPLALAVAERHGASPARLSMTPRLVPRADPIRQARRDV